MKVEEKIAKQTLVHQAERLEILNRTEQEIERRIDEKVNAFKDKYDEEIHSAKQQFHQVWIQMGNKEQLVAKLVSLL